MNATRTFAVLTLTAALAACAAPKPRTLVDLPPFPAAEYASLQQSGSASVTGQVFMKTAGGTVQLGAGNAVILEPATSYSSAYYAAYGNRDPEPPRDFYGQVEPLQPSFDPRRDQYVRQTTADAQGNFQFSGLPAGRYYVSSKVVWLAPVGGGAWQQGGTVTQEISVADGQGVRVMLTR